MKDNSRQFVVLRHRLPPGSGRADHFDLMLQTGGTLATWELARWPPLEPQNVRRLPDHRLEYLDYQGPVSDDRGDVTQICRGVFEMLVNEEDRVQVRLQASNFSGTICLRFEPGHQRWVLSLLSSDQPGNSE